MRTFCWFCKRSRKFKMMWSRVKLSASFHLSFCPSWCVSYWIHDAISCMGVPCTVIVVPLISSECTYEIEGGFDLFRDLRKITPAVFPLTRTLTRRGPASRSSCRRRKRSFSSQTPGWPSRRTGSCTSPAPSTCFTSATSTFSRGWRRSAITSSWACTRTPR